MSLTALLYACGGGGGGGAAVEQQPARTSNEPPLISGTPAQTVAVGATYSFIPAAGDANGDSLVFGIDGKPAWAAFDTRTGQLSGRPALSDAGTYRDIVVWVSDGNARTALPPFDVTVISPSATNRPPQIGGTPPGSVTAGTPYSFTPIASDPDGTRLSFTIKNRPAWASFDAGTGRLEGVPSVLSVGTFNGIEIAATDGEATVSLPVFNIVVTAPPINRPPVIGGAALTSVEGGRLYDFTPTASDADGDSLTFVVQNKPAWASFDAQSGRLFGTPAATPGTFANIIITVTDGQSSTSLPPFTIDVTVPTANRAPVIQGTPATSALQGAQYSFEPVASDADHDPLTFSIANPPSWATFNVSTGLLQGTPGAAHIGVYHNITISVSDGKSPPIALPAFAITVPQSNRAPAISGAPATTVAAGAAYTFTPTATDEDLDTLTFSAGNTPAWAVLDGATGKLSGTPATVNTGTYSSIVIRVSDGEITTSLPPFSITVTNATPVIGGAPPDTATVGTLYSFAPTASDANAGTTLMFSIHQTPAWATFDTGTGRLQGTPSLANVGTSSGIVIGVSDGVAAASLAPFSITVVKPPNQPPVISGVPPTTATVGTQYSFTPTASDPDAADTLTFDVANQPVWTAFDAASGRLDGMPGTGDVGTTNSIVISVHDADNASASLAAFSIVVRSNETQSALLFWVPPTENTDGSPLTDLAGYKIYWGTSEGSYPNSITLDQVGLATYLVEALAANTYFFVITAVNSAGIESLPTNAASVTLP